MFGRPFVRKSYCRMIYFWPLIVAGGRIVTRVILNLWNLIEPGGVQ